MTFIVLVRLKTNQTQIKGELNLKIYSILTLMISYVKKNRKHRMPNRILYQPDYRKSVVLYLGLFRILLSRNKACGKYNIYF